MQNCGMGLIKYILFAFNFLFALSGLGIVIAGASVLSNTSEFSHFLEGKIQAPPIVLIITGAIVFLIATLGCYGAIKESPTLLITYAVLLAIIFIIELAVGIAACLFKADLNDMLRESLVKTISRSDADDLATWDHTQRKLMCCGVDAPSDWADLGRDHVVRPSCCVKSLINEGTHDCSNSPALFKDRYYQEGCLNKLKEHIGGYATLLITVGLSVAFLQLVGIVLACWLASSIRREVN